MSNEIPADRQWFGHPRGLSTLFFTEMWERFSFYGLRALLILYMTAEVATGGLGFTNTKGGAILGLYTAGVYLLALPGGWIADRLIGPRNSVFIGGIIIASGHFSMALPALFSGPLQQTINVPSFYAGLLLIVIGTGLLKPNVSTIVGELYPEGGARRDAGFSVFYMGINIGAFAGPLLCGYLGENVSWHLGFGLAGIGMVAGLIQYKATAKYLGGCGHLKQTDPGVRQRDGGRFRVGLIAALAAIAVLAFLVYRGILVVSSEQIATTVGVVIVSLVAIYFLYMFSFGNLSAVEKKGMAMLAILFVASAIFWSGFEQASSSMNLFAEDLTNRSLMGTTVPTTWLQSVNPVFIILLAPVFGMIWQRLGSRDLSIPAKFALGLSILGVGFLVMTWAATYTEGKEAIFEEGGAAAGISMGWLVATYFFHTCGELCLSPVGLSSVTRLAPQRLVGQTMGIWFMATSLGNLMAGIAGGQFGSMTNYQLFGRVAVISIVAGIVLGLLTPLVLRRWTKQALAHEGGDVEPPHAPGGIAEPPE